MKKALITGITGQDGSYLAEFLLAKGYEVHGLIRRASSFNTARLDPIYQDPHESNTRLHLHYGDLLDSDTLHHLLDGVEPDEVYNLGAQSHVRVSFDMPIYTAETVALGTARLLEAIRNYQKHNGNGQKEKIRFYQASSSEMYGKAQEIPQTETTPFYPRSPYAAAKVHAYWLTVNYREAYGIHATNGILFNHESPRRGETFVTRKITRAVGRIKYGLENKLYLGNLDAERDWGFAGDYVDAMWRMLQEPVPDDYVIATGKKHSVREFLELAFGQVNLDWRNHVRQDVIYFRPSEVDLLIGDSTKARMKLRWEPKHSFEDLVHQMVESDLKLAAREKMLEEAGHFTSVPIDHDQ